MSTPTHVSPARDYKRIATEEAFAPGFVIDAWIDMLRNKRVADPAFESLHGFYLLSEAPRAHEIRERLKDVGEMRISHMDA